MNLSFQIIGAPLHDFSYYVSFLLPTHCQDLGSFSFIYIYNAFSFLHPYRSNEVFDRSAPYLIILYEMNKSPYFLHNTIHSLLFVYPSSSAAAFYTTYIYTFSSAANQMPLIFVLSFCNSPL